MKNIVLVIGLLLTTYISAQEISVYVPLRTVHYAHSEDVPYVKGEGGNIGAVLIHQTDYNGYFGNVQLGVVRNSYGEASVVVQKGWGKHIGRVNLSVNLGLASGYKIIYAEEVYITDELGRKRKYYFKLDRIQDKIVPKVLKDTGVIPTALLSIDYDTNTRVSPVLNISPSFINVGVKVRLK